MKVEDYRPKKYDKKFKHINVLKRRDEQSETTDVGSDGPTFDITSENDFIIGLNSIFASLFLF